MSSSTTSVKKRPALNLAKAASACSAQRPLLHGRARAIEELEIETPFGAPSTASCRLGRIGGPGGGVPARHGRHHSYLHPAKCPTGPTSGRAALPRGALDSLLLGPWVRLQEPLAPARHAGADQFIDRKPISARSAFSARAAWRTVGHRRFPSCPTLLPPAGRSCEKPYCHRAASCTQRHLFSAWRRPDLLDPGRNPNLYRQLGLLGDRHDNHSEAAGPGKPRWTYATSPYGFTDYDCWHA